MRNGIIYKLLSLISFLIFFGCEEHINKEVDPSLIPRNLNISRIKITAPSSEVYTTHLSVASVNSAWKFEGIPSWLSMEPYCGNSSAPVTVSFTKNLSADTSRYAVILFKDDMDEWDYKQTFTASQPQAIPYLKLSTDSLRVSGAAREYRIDVLSNASWRVEESCTWISTEVMDSALYLNIQVNNTGEYRETDIYVFAAAECMEIIHVAQATAHAMVEEKVLTFSNQATTAKFSIISESDWYATTSSSWLQITPEKGLAGTMEVTVDAAPNANVAERRGYITFNSRTTSELLTMEIVQKGLYVERNKSVLSFEAKESSMDLQINSNVEWEITSIPQWASSSTCKGSGDASISISVEDNPSVYQRTGILRIESPGLNLSTSVVLKQEGKTFNIGTTILEFSDKESINAIDITTDGTWVAQCSAEWLTLSPYSASGTSLLEISVTENIGDSERMAIVSITMSDKTIELVVRQQGKYLSMNNNQLVFPTKGGAINLHVATNDKWEALLKGNANWLKLSATEGEGAIDMVLSATDNASVNERNEVVSVIAKHGLSVELPVKQEARRLSVSASDVLFFSRGGTSEVITIHTNGEYRMSQVGDWFAVSRTGDSFTVKALKNETKRNREGSITFTIIDLIEGTYAVTIPVVQVREGCSFTLLGFGDDDSHNNSSGEGNFTGDSFEVDLDWNSSGSNAFAVKLVDFVADSNWDAIDNNAFTVAITGYREEGDWGSNNSSDPSLDKEDFVDDENWNE